MRFHLEFSYLNLKTNIFSNLNVHFALPLLHPSLSAYHPIVTDGERNSFSWSSNSAYCRSISREEDIFTDLPRNVGLKGRLADALGECLEKSPELRPSVENILEEVGDVEGDKKSLFEWFDDLEIEEMIRYNRRRQ